VGSFLNVCIARWPEGQSVLWPRSRCPACAAPIAPYDNVPILSYVWLRGRCRRCGVRISPQYPLVELATAGLWSAAVARHGPSWAALTTAVFLTLLLGIALTDARSYTIPDGFSLGGLALGLLLAPLPGGISLPQALLGALVGFGALALVAVLGEWVLRRPAMGGGDVKMLAMVGAFLGPLGALLTLFLGAFVGAVVFGPVALKRRVLVPFGVFLAVGAALTEAWGHELLAWYLRLVRGA
jgi:leader peptidase (prepilin peptidase)/N-methyltransferase